MPLISFVVPLYNHLLQTQQMLASLLASLPEGLDFEVVLVDDASSDGTATWLAQLDHPRVRWLVNSHNLGFAGTNNRGVAEARGEILGLLNNDLILSPGWLEPMLTLLTHPLRIAGLVGNVQRRVADDELDHAGIQLNPLGQFEHVRAMPTTAEYASVPWVTGACILMRRDLFQSLGGFDTRYLNGCEDLDLCFKVQAAGRKVYVAYLSCIQHHVSLSRSTNTLQDLRNSRLLFAQWRPEIKRKLGDVWRKLLISGSSTYKNFLVGELEPEFVSTPHVASLLIADAMLGREEAHWASQLDECLSDEMPRFRVKAEGLQVTPPYGTRVLERSAKFFVDGLVHARNFYVCGRHIKGENQSQTVTIRVNGLQTVKLELGTEVNVNAGFPDPLVFPGITNCFELEVNGQLLLSHIVIDDQVVKL